VFVTSYYFETSLFAIKAGTYPSGATYDNPSYGFSSAIIRLDRKMLIRTNTLSYYDAEEKKIYRTGTCGSM
jgi:hypothetical protein